MAWRSSSVGRFPFVVAVVVLAGCNALEPLPNTGTARSRLVSAAPATAPHVMVLLDASGSMALPLDPTDPACPAECGNPGQPCPAACPTRQSEARDALNALFDAAPDVRLGLTLFPSDPTCGAPRVTDVDVPAPGQPTDFQALRQRVNAFVPRGGTPTGAALDFVGQLPSMQPSADGSPGVVVVVTDGVPNCNDANPANACGASSSQCDLRSTSCSPNACVCTTSTCGGALCAIGCLDDAHTQTVIGELQAKGVQTVVVGFGPETDGPQATAVLQALARSSGPRDAFRARNRQELSESLHLALADFAPSACTFTLEKPLAPTETLEVRVGTRLLTTAEWQQVDASRVRLVGGACDDVSFTAVP